MNHSKGNIDCVGTYIAIHIQIKLLNNTPFVQHIFIFDKLTIEIAINAIEMNVKAINVFTAYSFCTKDFCKQKL